MSGPAFDWPGWLESYLDRSGIRDTTTRLTHETQRATCPNCQAMVLAALDDLSLPVRVDAMPTTAAGELIALLGGQRTYTLIHGELCRRDFNRIAYCSADDEPVHPEHSCPGELPINDRFAPRPTRTAIYDEPPF